MLQQWVEAGGYFLIAALLAALVPLGLIATKFELRKVRLRLVNELRANLFRDQRDLPQLELAAAKYRATSDRAGQTRQALVMVWTGAAFYFLISLGGFLILLTPREWLIGSVPNFPSMVNALLWTNEPTSCPAPTGCTAVNAMVQPLTVAGIGFLGGYIFQLRYLLRATINQELSALAFVRATLYVLQGTFIALILYRIAAAAVTVDNRAEMAVVLALAFTVGLFPALGLARIAKAARANRKGVNEAVLQDAQQITPEVIEGIDAESAVRLEESNIFDVQNLATANPITLYAETPFGLLEIFDWVLQAQLCVNVGPMAMKSLKQHRIRTIFDLERAVLATGAPTAYVQAIGAVLFAEASPEFRRRVGLPPAPSDTPVTGLDIDVATVRHAVAVIADDLHVSRLRALWRVMIRTTAGIAVGQSPWLHETGELPGDPHFTMPPLTPAAEAFIRRADHHAREHAAQRQAGAAAPILAASRAACLDAAGQAIAIDATARERLRLLWDPTYLRKRPDETSLEIFYGDPDFKALLDPLAP